MLLSRSCSLFPRSSRVPHSFQSSPYSASSHVEQDVPLQRNLKRLYLKENHYKDRQEFLEHLKKSVVYFDPEKDPFGLVALNKPCGLPVNPSEDSDYNLKEALPFLAQALGVEQLHFVKAPESAKAASHIQKCRQRCRRERHFGERHLALVNGFPRMTGKNETVDLLRERVDKREPMFGKHHVEPVIVRTLKSKRFMRNKENKAKRVHVLSETLARSSAGQAALVSVQTTTNSHHFIQVYLSDLLSPVLGDWMFSYRARPVMGVMTKVGHAMSPMEPNQAIPDWLRLQLGLRRGQEKVLPKHVHLARTYLPGYLGKDEGGGLSVYAPPPPFFAATADALKIRMDVAAIFDQDAVQSYKREEQEETEVELTHRAEDK